MTKTAASRIRAGLTLTFTLATAAFIAGCVSYSPGQLARMPSVDLCDLRATQGINLSDDTKRALDGELQRRNDNCTNYAAVIAQRRDAFMYREMYGKQDNP
ncbi:MAG: hypothetical protein JWN13_594 [Betaproteobacteria bacterium]|jgi:hypothetical protein|nr:hypothetical protein [Betaproteobacteria bacterium]